MRNDDYIDNKNDTKKKLSVMMILAIIAFIIALIVDGYFAIIWTEIAYMVITVTENNKEQVVARIVSILLIFPIWLFAVPAPSVISILFSSFSIKKRKFFIITLIIIILLLILNTFDVLVVLYYNNSNS